ncbi:LPS assembly lipoprotein LptE [Rhodosalinus sp. 5P4]|uniref:LPS assembly lipoprotein LptE n=1 Tax=Rhodosalinus sp. 5P4 TaxID=3239196 RepID=UPI0035252E30
MSWSDRRSFVLAACAAALAGCGFAPVYAPGGGASRLQGQVAFSAPGTRAGFDLRARLEERLGVATAGRYALDVVPSVRSEGLGSTRDGRTSRFQLVGSAAFTLSDAEGGTVLAEGEVDGFTGYSTTGSIVATEAARRDAETRLMRLLADRIVDRLLLAAPDLS